MKKFLTIIALSSLLLAGSVSAIAPLIVPDGGTGRATLPAGQLLVGNGTGAINSTTSPTLGFINATSGTSTIDRLSVTSAVSLMGEYFTNFTDYVRSLFTAGTGILINTGVISLDESVSPNWSGTHTFLNPPVSTQNATTSTQIPNWGQVSAISQGLIVKESVKVATVSAISTSTEQTIDGVAVVTGDRVLVKNQAQAWRNGIYIVATGDWSRATDYDESGEVQEGTFMAVLEGNINATKIFVQYQIDPVITVDALNFTELSSAINYSSANGISESSNVFSLGGTLNQNTSINQANYSFDHNLNGSGDFNVTDAGSPVLTVDDTGKTTITNLVANWLSATSSLDFWYNSSSTIKIVDLAGSWITGILGLNHGGTGAITAQGARTNILPSQAGNVDKALLTDGTDAYWGTVATGDGSATSTFGNTKQLAWVANGATYSTWTDMPIIEADLFMGSTTPNSGSSYYKRFDLTNAYRFRTVRNLSVAGFAGSYLKLQYSTDKVNWFNAGTDDDCTLVGVGSIPCNWATLVTGARTDVYLRYRGLAGNNIIDPRFYNLVTEFTLYSSTDNANATTTDSLPFLISPQANQLWSNMPLAKSGTYYIGFGSAYHYQTANLYKANKYRIVSTIATSTTANQNPISTMRVDVQFSYDKTTWYNLNSGTVSPATGTGELDIYQNLNTVNTGSWVNVAEGAKSAVWLRFVGYGGNGVNDVQFRNIEIQIEQNLQADVTTQVFSTTSADHWISTYDKGYFWSTTSADVWGATKGYLTDLLGGLNAILGNSTTTGYTSLATTTWFSDLSLGQYTMPTTAIAGTVIDFFSPVTKFLGIEDSLILWGKNGNYGSLTLGGDDSDNISVFSTEPNASTTSWTMYDKDNFPTPIDATFTFYGNTAVTGTSTVGTAMVLTGITDTYLATNNQGKIIATTTPTGGTGIETDPIFMAASTSLNYQPVGSYLTSESDPVWMTASTSYCKLDANNNLTGTNTFGDANTYTRLGNVDIGGGVMVPSISFSSPDLAGIIGSGFGIIKNSIFINNYDPNANVSILMQNTTSGGNALMITSTSSDDVMAFSAGGFSFDNDLTILSGKGLTLGGEYRTTWPTGGGGSGDSLWATSSTNVAHPAFGSDPSIVVGASVLSDSALKLEVVGDTKLGSTTISNINLPIYGSLLATNNAGTVIATGTPTIIESDPVFMSASTSLDYVKTETDPVFTSSFAHSIASSTNWDTAFNWGNWSTGVWASSSLSTILNNAVTAYGWGNHASAGYLTNLLGGLNAILGNATTTNLAITGVTNSYLSTNGLGQVIATTTPVLAESDPNAILKSLGTTAGDLITFSGASTPVRLADVAVGKYLRSGGIAAQPVWSTLTLPNAGTAYRLPVYTSSNTMGELAAVGSTGQYLSGATGAIPAWATLNQAAVAGLTTTDTPTFKGATLNGTTSLNVSDTVIRGLMTQSTNPRASLWMESEASGNQIGSIYSGVGFYPTYNSVTFPTFARTNQFLYPNFTQINMTGFHFFGDTTGAVGSTFTPTERMVITNDGLVGIGKTPVTTLDVNGTASSTALVVDKAQLSYSGTNGMALYTPTTGLELKAGTGKEVMISANGTEQASFDGSSMSLSDTVFKMFSSVTEKVRIAISGDSWFTGGNVGIGKTNPSTALDVVGTASSTALQVNGVANITATTTIGTATGKKGALKVRDTDSGGWSYTTYLNGVASVSASDPGCGMAYACVEIGSE